MAGQHVRIGAAVEIFVLVLLSNLNSRLPSLGLDNWKSTIRHNAAAHPSYSDLMSWIGRETSDIVYDDVSGVLTDLLINKGHLKSGQWVAKTPRYSIEVKGTLDRCETPFYVSQSQADRVLSTTNGPSGFNNRHEIYVLFRVFNLGTESTGLKIYVDPEQQRRSGKLKFITDGTYMVIAAAGV